jgi:hypothetical protein
MDLSAKLYQESYWPDTIGTGGRLDIMSKKAATIRLLLELTSS